MNKFLQYLCTPLLPARIGRIQFLNASNTNFILAITLLLLELVYTEMYNIDENSPIMILLWLITRFFILFSVVNETILSVKRLRDMNRSGW
ncbi:MAG: DUF805 domain-containing protein [Rickettsiaceae bacterium]|nr:MAG: DUF805 domain-containing protein [Rickettsiaceae bacterium]